MSTEIATTENKNELATTRQERTVRPSYEVHSTEETYEVTVAMPGVSKDGLNVTLDKDDLLIEGTRKPYRQSDWNPVHREITDANYRLRLQLNVAIAEEKIGARIEDGLLVVTLPVAEEAKPRTIAVE